MNELAVYEIRLKDAFSKGLASLDQKMNHFEGKVGGLQGSFNGLGSSITGAFAGGLVAGGIATLVSGLKGIAVEAFNTAREFTNLKDAIIFASGDQAKTNIQFLDKEIETLGLDMQSTYKGFKTFEGALMGTSLEGEKGRKIFDSVSKAASVMKLSADATEGSFLALGQMISKGTVSAEELRGQLGERLPGAFQIAARAMGVTTAQLGKMMQAGQLSADEFLPKFAAELDKTFGPGVLKAQDSFNANWNRFNNFIERAKISFGTGMLPLINEFISVIPKLDFSFLISPYEDYIIELKQLGAAFGELFSLFGANLSTVDAISVGFRYFSFVMRNTLLPVKLLIEGYTEFLILIRGSLNVFQGLGQVMKGVFTGNLDLINKGIDTVGGSVLNLKEKLKNSAGDFIKREKEGYNKIFSPFDESEKGNGSQGQSTTGLNSGLPGSTASGKQGGRRSSSDAPQLGSGGVKNITIKLDSLVGQINFAELNNLTQQQAVNILKKGLLTAVNDANLALNN